jgi:hypothetical protein
MPTLEGIFQHSGSAILQSQKPGRDDAISRLLSRLKWLGLSGISKHAELSALHAVQSILSCCTGLRTISIRQKHHAEPKDFQNTQDYVYRLTHTIAQHAPQTVTTLELRPSPPFPSHLINILKSQESSIKYIGIDLGAWIQRYTQKLTADDLEETEIKKSAEAIARKCRFEAYEANHHECLKAGSNSWLPESRFDQDEPGQNESYSSSAKHAFEHVFFCDDRAPNSVLHSTRLESPREWRCPLNVSDHQANLARYHEPMKATTLPAMLNNLHQTGIAHKDFRLFALEPEWQMKSSDPIPPFALLQHISSTGPPEIPLVDRTASNAMTAEVYKWLKLTFNWCPIFDWDWFIKPDYENLHSSLNSAYGKLKRQRGLDATYSQFSQDNELVADIAKEFVLLKDASIPLHLLIGHRSPGRSSLYWGWPYDATTWSQWLSTPFDASCRPSHLSSTL